METCRIIKISNDLGAIQKVIDEINKSLETRCDSEDIQAISMSLYEVITNAIEHGNLAIDWETKNKALQGGTLDDLMEERMQKEPFASRNVTIEYKIDNEKATFIIGDDGDGFNWRDIPDPTKEENVTAPHGRGLFIIRSLMDDISFDGNGNKITLVKYFTGDSNH